MIILGINTATRTTELSLLKGSEVVFEDSWESDFNEAEKILPALKTILKEENNLDRIFVVKGPGSFTGLRVGTVIANTIAFMKNIRLIEINTFEYLKSKVPKEIIKETVIVMRAGGKHLAYMYPNETKIRKTTTEKIQEIFTMNKKNYKYAVGDINGDQCNFPKSVKLLNQNDLLPMSEVMKKPATLKKKSLKMVKPVYLNPPQITKSKKQCFT